MNLDVSSENGVTRIGVVPSRIDASVAIQFKDAMRQATEGRSGRIVLDLGAVDFVDSSGLGAIVAAMKNIDASARLELAGMRPDVEKVFRLTRMDSVFVIHPDAASAMTPRRAG